MRTARFAPLGFVPLVVIVLVALHDRLPDPMAVHWSGAGHANGHQSQLSLGVLLVVLWLLVWSPFVLMRGELVAGYAALGLLLAVFVCVVVVNLDAGSWQEPELDWRGLVGIAGGAGAGGLLGGVVARRLPAG
jgi:uncharacterized membrane protein